MAQIDIDKFVLSLRRHFGDDKGIATRLDRVLFSLGLKFVDTPTGGRFERADQPTMLERMLNKEQKPAEWSEEDERRFISLEESLDDYLDYVGEDTSLPKCQRKSTKEKVISISNWLKSLRSQKQWKPTEEQMDALDKIVDYYLAECNDDESVYNPTCKHAQELLEQLKQL